MSLSRVSTVWRQRRFPIQFPIVMKQWIWPNNKKSQLKKKRTINHNINDVHVHSSIRPLRRNEREMERRNDHSNEKIITLEQFVNPFFLEIVFFRQFCFDSSIQWNNSKCSLCTEDEDWGLRTSKRAFFLFSQHLSICCFSIEIGLNW